VERETGWYNKNMNNTINTLIQTTAMELKESAIASVETEGHSREEAIKIVNSIDYSKPFHTPTEQF